MVVAFEVVAFPRMVKLPFTVEEALEMKPVRVAKPLVVSVWKFAPFVALNTPPMVVDALTAKLVVVAFVVVALPLMTKFP